jgi:hypothetical protein
MTTSIRASLARLAMTAMAKHDIRYYLNGILVEPRPEGGAYIVATDGHRLMAIIDAEATCDARILLKPDRTTQRHLPLADDLKRDTKKATLQLTEFNGKPALLVTDAEGKALHLQITDASMEDINGNSRPVFPDWRRVVPKFEDLKPGAVDGLNPTYVTPFLSAIAKARHCRITLEAWQTEKGQVTAFRLDYFPHVLYLVMPKREGDGSGSWISNWSAAKGQQSWRPPAANDAEAAPVAEPATGTTPP